MDNFNLSDIAAVTGGGANNMAGGNWFLILALFFLFTIGGNFGGRGNCATTEDLASGFNFNALQNKGNETLAAINGVNTNLGNAICSLGYQTGRDFADLSRQVSDCCCSTQRSIDTVKFDMANYAAAINANVTAQNQRVLDAIKDNEISMLKAQVSDLKLSNALCGVVRFPTEVTYAAACNPFCSSNGNGQGQAVKFA